MFTFSIIENNIAKRYAQIRALHIMLALLIIVVGISVYAHASNFTILSSLFFMIGFIILAISLFKKKTWLQLLPHNIARVVEVVLLVFGSNHFYMQKMVVPGICFLLVGILLIPIFLVEKSILQGKKVIFKNGGAFIENGLYVKNIQWPKIERVILKHQILTIDCKNNHLIQLKVQENEMPEFVEYCQQQMQ